MTETQAAIHFITTCCSTIGMFGHPNAHEVYDFIGHTALDIQESLSTPLFPHEYKEHIAHALKMVSDHPGFTSPGAVASVYLATRFEFYFRLLSGLLNSDGSWVSEEARTKVETEFPDAKIGKYVSNVALTYKIMKLNERLPIIQIFNQLDSKLFTREQKSPIWGTEEEYPEPITNIGQRIKYSRDGVSHGQWGDISAEAIFYSLLTGIIFYNRPFYP